MESRPIPYASEGLGEAVRAPYAPGGPEVAGRGLGERPGGPLAALRAVHHALARAEAEGGSLTRLAALACDLAGRPWSAAELERLLRSPAFRELVASYKRAA